MKSVIVISIVCGVFIYSAIQLIQHNDQPFLHRSTSRSLQSNDGDVDPNDRDYVRRWITRGDQEISSKESYLLDVALWAILGVAIAVLSCIVCICCSCGKYCCKCRCCVTPKYQRLDEKRVCCSTQKGKTALRVTIFVLSSLMVIAVALGFAGNGLMSRGIRSFADITVDEIEDFQHAANNITSSLAKVSGSIDDTLIQFNNSVNDITNAAQHVQDIVYSIDLSRVFIIYFGFQFALTTAAVSIAAAILQKNRVFDFMMLMGFLCLFFMWLTFAIHTPLSILADDLCYTIHEFFMEARNDKDSPLSFLLSCLDSGEYTPILGDVFSLIQEELNQLNATTYQQLNFTFNPHLPNFNGTAEDQLIGMMSFVNGIVSTVDTEIEQHGGQTFSSITDILDKCSLIIGVAQTLIDLIRCSNLKQLVTGLSDSVCASMLNGLVLIVLSSGAIGILAIPLTIVGALSTNRFDRNLEYIKSKLIVEFVCVIQIVLGLVSATTFGSGAALAALWVGLVNVVIPIIGFVGARLLKRGVILFYAIVETLWSFVCILMIALVSFAIAECQEPECSAADRIGAIIAVFYVSLGLIPVTLGMVSAWTLWRNFEHVSVQARIADELEPLSNTFRDTY